MAEYQAPIEVLQRKLTQSGMSLELSGFVWSAILGILRWQEPLPADASKAMPRVGVHDIRRYRRLLSEGIAAGALEVLDTGEVTAPLAAEFEPARSRHFRSERTVRLPIPQDTDILSA